MTKASLLLFISLSPFLSQAQSDTIPLIKPKEILNSVIQWRSDKEYSKAIEALKSVPVNDTSYALMQYELLGTYNLSGDYENAKKLGTQLLMIPSDQKSNVYIEYGNSWLNSGDQQKAISIYNEGLSVYPYNYILHNNIGVAYFRSGQYNEASRHFKESLGINPLYSNSHLMLARVMILQGQRSRAMLGLLTYLMLRKEDNGALVLLENLVNNADRSEGSIGLTVDSRTFHDPELLMRSKAPLDQRFRSSVDFNASLVKYTELLLESLRFDPARDDFWMRTYVPLFTTIHQQKLTPALIYSILSSTGNEVVVKWLNSHTQEVGLLDEVRKSQLGQLNKKRTLSLLGEENEYPVWYYENGTLNAFGFEKADESRFGPWVIYYDNGEKSSLGRYDADGKMIGEWQFFYRNGQLQRKEHYDNRGKLSGVNSYYSDRGSLTVEVPYENGEVNGTVKFYYPCGNLKEAQPWKNNLMHGKGEVVYSTGEKQVSLLKEEDMFQGDYINFFKSGTEKSHSVYVNDTLQGPFTAYYRDMLLSEKGQYEGGMATGPWQGWHPNGNKSYTGQFTDDEKSGEWVYFNEDGTPRAIESYNTGGLLHGKVTYYSTKGSVSREEEFNRDTLVAATYFTPAGEVLYKAQNPSGNMTGKSFNEKGVLLMEGTYQNGTLNGPLTYYHSNGKPSQSGTAVNSNWEGEYKSYHKTGELKEYYFYKDKVQDGYYREYFRNGNIKSEGWHVGGQPVQFWNNYFPDGTLMQRNYLLEGELHGPTYAYAPDGKLESVYVYHKGIVESITLYDTLGQPYYETTLTNGSGDYELQYKNGKVLKKSTAVCGVMTEDVFTYYPDGRLETKTPVSNAEYNGTYEAFHDDGKVMARGDYLHNEQHGLWSWYDEEGKISSTTEYLQDQQNGLRTQYYPSGQMESQCFTKNDERNGVCRFYSESGVLQLEKLYENDEMTGYRYLLPDNTLSDIIPFSQTGDFKLISYYPNKRISCEQQYKDGQLHGVSRYYTPEGKIQEEGKYEGGDLSGVYKTFYPSGQLQEEELFVFDVRDGTQKEFYPNGKLKKSREYKMGRLHGLEVTFNSDGSVNRKKYYRNGDLYE